MTAEETKGPGSGGAKDPLHDYASMLSAAIAAATQQIEQVRLPLGILLDNQFGELNENQIEMIGAAQSAAQAAEEELRRLKRIADLDSEPAPLRSEAIRPVDFISPLLQVVMSRAQRSGIDFSADVSPALPRVRGDRRQLHEAMAAVLSDLIARSSYGDAIRLEARAETGVLRITIAHSATLQPTLEMAIASRIILGLGGRWEDRPDRVTIELPRDKPGA